MADPLIRFIEQLLIVDEALTPEEDTGVFVESLLRVRQALFAHDGVMPEPPIPNWNMQTEKSKPRGKDLGEIVYDVSGVPVGLQRCESDDDVPLPADWQEKVTADLQQVEDGRRTLDNWCNDKPKTDE